MNFFNNFRIALRALMANKLRSSLTMLGIIIGVAAVVALLSIGRGATSSITDQVEGMGTNLITVSQGRTFNAGMGGASTSSSLYLKDYEAILENVDGIGGISPYYSTQMQISTSDRTSSYSVIGTTPTYFEVNNLELDSGRFITDADNMSKKKVAVIGSSVSSDLFEGLNPIGRTVKINNVSFEVIGVLATKGTLGFLTGDSSIIIPLNTGYARIFGSRAIENGKYVLSSISLSVANPDMVDSVISQIDLVLRSQHGLGLNDELGFSVSSQEQMLSSMSTITDTLSIFLGAIAGISLLVGGIGIMNITLVSVKERTREIGLRKAVGATRSSILVQFLVETFTLAILGGILGILLGAGIAWVVSFLGLINSKVTWDVILLAVGSSTLIGLFFGIYPAYQASKLNPIDALRYE
ncbi:MAG TPA: multidrug ABC transporter substrate-binding protein [Anaerolineaceae bacterium]|nr:multidrug ABC transporter substrate-binding protein [Anaerolineaceae bacterium]